VNDLKTISDNIRGILDEKNRAREEALRLSREAIRHSANSIRAIHRSQWDEAESLMAEARSRVQAVKELLKGHPDIYFAGYTQDAQKEYAESELTMAIVRGRELKTPEDLGVEPAPFLNALGEAIGETRRHILDVMRKGDLARAEEILDIMDDVYFALVTFDYPDAITNGLRRTTDMVRGVLERTRSDLTITMRQADLEKSIASAVERIRT
jgi:translin